MEYLKKQDGFVSTIILIILLIILACCIFFILDIFGFIDVPKEYSITRFLESDMEEIYQADSMENEHNVTIRKKVKDRENDERESTELKISNVVQSQYTSEKQYKNYNRYYYEQLDESAKIMYNGIVDNFENLKTGTYVINFGKQFNDLLHEDNGEDSLNHCFQSAVNAVLLDNPEFFFLDITKMYLLTHSTTFAFTGTTYEVSIGPNENQSYLNKSFSASSINREQAKIEAERDNIIDSLSGNNMDKVKQVHDYLIDNLEYDSSFSNSNIYNIYGALVKKSTVCEGYAKAFKYLMDEIGIPCVVVCGNAENSRGEIENHAWNYVFINSGWYAIDVTWDDPIIIGGGTATEESRYKYFLRGSEYLSNDHEENGVIVDGVIFSYPRLNRSDY